MNYTMYNRVRNVQTEACSTVIGVFGTTHSRITEVSCVKFITGACTDSMGCSGMLTQVARASKSQVVFDRIHARITQIG